MQIYSINKGKLNHIESLDFKLEKEMQSLCESNLFELFGLELVKSEFVLSGLRMDTLAFDLEVKSFVVIEYKRDRNFSLIDQGYAYLSSILNNKAECVLEYNENRNLPIKRENVDWTQTRVIFMAPSFTQYQIQSINFKDLPFELWELKKYSNDILSVGQIQHLGSKESVKTISKVSTEIKGVSKEIKVHTEEDHLAVANSDTKELYELLKSYLVSLGDGIKVKPKKQSIGFIAKSNFVDVHIQKEGLKAWLNLKKGELNDPKKLARDMSILGHWGNGDYELHLKNVEDIDYFLGLAKQAYKKNS
jgi:predicted transport protein